MWHERALNLRKETPTADGSAKKYFSNSLDQARTFHSRQCWHIMFSLSFVSSVHIPHRWQIQCGIWVMMLIGCFNIMDQAASRIFRPTPATPSLFVVYLKLKQPFNSTEMMEFAWLCTKGLRAVHWWLFSITQAEENSWFKKIYLDFF